MTKLKMTVAALLVIATPAASAFLLASDDRQAALGDEPPRRVVKASELPDAQLRREIQETVRSASTVSLDGRRRGRDGESVQTLLVLAKAQVKIGDRDAARETLGRAAQVAEDEKPENDKTMDRRPGLLARVALAQVQAGDPEAVRKTLGKAIGATDALNFAEWKSDPLKVIVAVQMALGDRDTAKATLQTLRTGVRKVGSDPMASNAWSDLIWATARTGDYDGAIASAAEVSHKMTRHLTQAEWQRQVHQDEGLWEIVRVAAKSGDTKQALRVTDMIAGEGIKERALSQIAMSQAESGDVEGARAWVAQLGSPRLKAGALHGLALGLASRAGAGWEAMRAMDP